jgi:hypothetical protein
MKTEKYLTIKTKKCITLSDKALTDLIGCLCTHALNKYHLEECSVFFVDKKIFIDFVNSKYNDGPTNYEQLKNNKCKYIFTAILPENGICHMFLEEDDIGRLPILIPEFFKKISTARCTSLLNKNIH